MVETGQLPPSTAPAPPPTSIVDAAAVPLSDKAQGKRKQSDQDLDAPSIAPITTVAATTTREKRVTRSSLGGHGASNGLAGGNGFGSGAMSRQGSEAGASEAALLRPHLPLSTPILLTLSLPSDVVHYPPLETDLGWSFGEEPCPIPPIEPLPNSIPSYRLLDKAGDPSLGRSRHVTGPEFDTSDAHYHRLHRFPEILEKRSARLERDRLIHERSKLILELEELKGRGWVYIGAQGGKGEEERRRRIREGELRLMRYDALLPNQPRKSNSLVVQASDSSSSVAHAHAHAVAANGSRSHSPAFLHNGRPSSRGAGGHRPSTPISASGDGSTTIKIKFTHDTSNATSAQNGARPRKPSRASGISEDSSDNRSQQARESLTSSTGVGAMKKRDRAAEHARARERERLGLPIKGKMSDLLEARQSHAQPDHHSRQDPPGSNQPSTPVAPPLPKRIRLKDSFFTSPALRDAYLAQNNSGSAGRRSSSRTAYAFGQRLPEVALLREVEFELHGSGLEEMVLEREGDQGKVVFEGRVVPRSAIEVLSRGPIKDNSGRVETTTMREGKSDKIRTMTLDSSPPAELGKTSRRRRSSSSSMLKFAPPVVESDEVEVVEEST